MMVLFILLLFANNTISDLSVREMYKASTKDEETCLELLEQLKEDGQTESMTSIVSNIFYINGNQLNPKVERAASLTALPPPFLIILALLESRDQQLSVVPQKV